MKAVVVVPVVVMFVAVVVVLEVVMAWDACVEVRGGNF